MTAVSACLATGVNHGCPRCGNAIDSLCFDDSRVIENWPAARREELLASFELPPQYCGVLESFMQFTDTHARDPGLILTPSVHWRLLVDRHPIAPYVDLHCIVNPWGAWQAPGLVIKLPAGARIDLVARRMPGVADNIQVVAGRITGRYWYDLSFGALDRGRARVS
jgi:hypothetical protein